MIVSFTVVRYKKAYTFFALMAMALHRLPMAMQKGCSFWKLLGSGKNGTFDLSPDWQQWGLLAVWDNRDDYERFKENSFVTRWWKRFCMETWTVLCIPLQSHGLWDGKDPFKTPALDLTYAGPIAVLTRATIRFNKLKNFWSHVDEVAELMAKAPGYIMSVGIGEAPVYKQATFSVWTSGDAMKAFAYKSDEHKNVIRKTHQEDWYSEALFARFEPIASFGTINGKDPLENII